MQACICCQVSISNITEMNYLFQNPKSNFNAFWHTESGNNITKKN